jgi:hypothetical protein
MLLQRWQDLASGAWRAAPSDDFVLGELMCLAYSEIQRDAKFAARSRSISLLAERLSFRANGSHSDVHFTLIGRIVAA